MDVFAVKSKNILRKMNSSSGGVWIELADYCLNSGWYVYGVVMDNSRALFRRFAPEDFSEIHKTQGSKYVQAFMGDVLKQVKCDLERGNSVLFCGTPCQVSAVANMALLVNSKGQLITIDIICHGVPSPKVFSDYYDLKEKINKGKIERFSFRDKKNGSWTECKETFEIHHKLYDADDWAKMFYQHDILRPSCYKCRFTNLNRVSDITLGDFWGIEKLNLDFYDDMGVSLVLVNTEVGRTLLKKIYKDIELIEADIKYAKQPQLYKPVRRPILRNLIWRRYYKSGIEGVLSCMNTLSLYTFLDKTIKIVKKVVKKIVVAAQHVMRFARKRR